MFRIRPENGPNPKKLSSWVSKEDVRVTDKVLSLIELGIRANQQTAFGEERINLDMALQFMESVKSMNLELINLLDKELSNDQFNEITKNFKTDKDTE